MTADWHLPFSNGWNVWKWLIVRGAGFPARGVLELADVETAQLADSLLALERAVATACAGAGDELRAEIRDTDGRDKLSRRVRKGLRRGEIIDDAAQLAGISPMLDEALRLRNHRAEIEQQLDASYAGALGRSYQVLKRWASEPRFREAVLWQNRRAVETALDRVIAEPAGNRRERRRELLVASYLQRYCVKNDTIGFFGPLLWSEVADTGQLAPGRDLVTHRHVYFEYWAIATLARKLAEDPEVMRDIAPRRVPSVELEGTTVRYGVSGKTSLPPAFARVLRACDGARTAREIAAGLVREGSDDVESEDEVFEYLEQLASKKLVRWALDVPTAAVNPEEPLRESLAKVTGDAGSRARAALDELVARREDVARAAGDPVALENALARIEATFARLTGTETTRRGGETYASRTLLYEDTHRDVDLRIPHRLLDQISAPLALLLDSARWCTYQLASRTRALLDRAFDELVAETGEPIVRYAAFHARANDVLPLDSKAPLVQAIREELQQRWLEMLDIDPGERELRRTSAELANGVRTAFAAPGPGWPNARFQSPDLMIAARAFDEIGTPAARPVLGELHIGWNTLVAEACMKEAPHRDTLRRAYTADLATAPVERVIPSEFRHRANGQLPATNLCMLEIGDTPAWWPPAERDDARTQRIGVGELVVQRAGPGLRVRTRDGRADFDVIAFYAGVLLDAALSICSITPPLPHVPRIVIDDLIVSRERWRVPGTDAVWATLESGWNQFVRAREWAKTLGLPRFIFVKIPEETKPFYVDFDSPTYVDMFAKYIRQASILSMSEMLPMVDETWLHDTHGNTYTCEIRLAAVDVSPFAPQVNAAPSETAARRGAEASSSAPSR